MFEVQHHQRNNIRRLREATSPYRNRRRTIATTQLHTRLWRERKEQLTIQQLSSAALTAIPRYLASARSDDHHHHRHGDSEEHRTGYDQALEARLCPDRSSSVFSRRYLDWSRSCCFRTRCGAAPGAALAPAISGRLTSYDLCSKHRTGLAQVRSWENPCSLRGCFQLTRPQALA